MKFEYRLILQALKEVTKIKYAQKALRENTKQNFNLFYGLAGSKFHLEKYHSNFIGYLLNPKESHDCGSFFLKKFIDKIKDKINERTDFTGLFSSTNTLSDEDLDIENIKLSKEEEIETGRKIDITIKSSHNNWIIFIENKIDSGEGMNQVKDYFDSCKKNYSEKILGIYLTLAGGEPNSTKDLVDAKKKILAISYKLIIDWLEECCVHKEIIRYPHIINSLLQYVTVLKRKLNIMEDAEKEKLKNWLEKDGDASFEILTNAQELLEINKEIVKDIRKEFHQELVNTVANSLKTINGFELPDSKYDDGIICLYNSQEFMVRLEYSFPDVSPEGEGKGLWWGIFHTDLSPYLPIAILQEKWWEPVYLNKVDDYNQDALGYKEITLSLRNIDTKNNLIKAAAKSIIDQIVEKVLPVLTKISLQTQ